MIQQRESEAGCSDAVKRSDEPTRKRGSDEVTRRWAFDAAQMVIDDRSEGEEDRSDPALEGEAADLHIVLFCFN